MTFIELIKAAIPGCSDETAAYVLWNRTPFPFDAEPKMLFKKARGYARACASGRQQCELCDNLARPGEWECQSCYDALTSHRTLTN